MGEPAAIDVRGRLLAWYDANRRDLPWRRTRDPYRILVAEVLLQRTRVAGGVPYYERFLARFPTVRDLAAAPLDDVLAAWEGLGFYRRHVDPIRAGAAYRLNGNRLDVPPYAASPLATRGPTYDTARGWSTSTLPP